MEMRQLTYRLRSCRNIAMLTLAMAFSWNCIAQTAPVYSFRDGKMYIELQKNISEKVLNEFISQYNLKELDLNNFLKTGNPDSLHKLGWQIEFDAHQKLRLVRAFEAFGSEHFSTDRIVLDHEPIFPSTGHGLVFGVNKFRGKQAFAVNNGEVTFFLRDHLRARNVMLAGSFNNWDPAALSMTRTDSGWIANVKLTPGKWWYKFIVDGNWIVDPQNLNKENDGVGNLNSIYFVPNIIFKTSLFANAKQVYLAGSFNNWDPKELAMIKTQTGWMLPVYLADGTHTYKFVVDGNWYSDESNEERLPDGEGGLNSVIRMGAPHVFKLEGFAKAAKVFIAGSFNGWREDELQMKPAPGGWMLPYTLAPGNHEFKFVVDGKSIHDVTAGKSKKNFLAVIQANYTFSLDGFSDAKEVYLAGEFNGWNPAAYPMTKQGDKWVLPLHLPIGKHLYKFVVDGKWIIDPANKLWEENEHGTGNSVLWIEK